MFEDLKAYKKHTPMYPDWKAQRDLQEAKRLEYLKQNPDKFNKEDVKRGEVLIRAVNIMDEYSQKNAENMEMATETLMGQVAGIASMIGTAIGGVLAFAKKGAYLEKAHSLFKKVYPKITKDASSIGFVMIPTIICTLLASIPAQFLAARLEVSASKRGRYTAMREDLKDAKNFAVLTDAQIAQADKYAKENPLEYKKEKKKDRSTLGESIALLKDYVFKTKSYNEEKAKFNAKLDAQVRNFDKELSPQKIEDAKRDQQLLTQIVEEIDIASQDYAENAELATSALTTTIFGFGTLFSMGLQKVLSLCKVKSASKVGLISQSLSVLATIGATLYQTAIQKEASRIGRFKVKQALMDNPEKLVYVSDEASGSIKDIVANQREKQGFLKFLFNVWKDKKAYDNYKKTDALYEKQFMEGVKKLELSKEQLEDAKQLRQNTFMTFNKVDENSQKYSESVEATGNAIASPIVMLASLVGISLGTAGKPPQTILQGSKQLVRYVSCIIASAIPAIIINAIITKKQKQASRVADMVSINELNDYRHFANYNDIDKQATNVEAKSLA